MTEMQIHQIPFAYNLPSGMMVRITEKSPLTGYIKEVNPIFHEGCDGLVDIRIQQDGKQVFPAHGYGQRYLALNSATPKYRLNEPVKAGSPILVEIGNADDTNGHEVTILLHVEGTGDFAGTESTITSLPTTYETRGTGKPDYSQEVSSSRERRGLYLKYNQSLVIFGRVFSNVASPYAWVGAPLAAGATISLMDLATGLAMPYTVPQGYGLSHVEAETSHSEDLVGLTYLDTFLAQSMGPLAAGAHTYIQRILGFSTITLDPTGELGPHTVDTQITNHGVGALSGEVAIITLLEALGTEPLPTTKVVKCKFCGHEQVVPQNTSSVICSECGKLTIYENLSRFRRTP